ncbi:vacuolar ATP synthase subunit-like, putative [Bodo saltans]|uniref:V-type proton ATPase subunit n=1 Tax=Bodo saltans TaxID=75058 RepID=A0A0S4INJ3_BODSA|nr:vacuolar ATP synthase subunit-like, putative [Bodo saltans]|eukprot:CUE87609.1 vacuolar ATP synthase subunit-like, putative [Bodo saltans]
MRSMLNFNVHEGNLEAIVHGYKNGLLRPEEYNNLCQCDALVDLKAQLQVTEYGNFLQNEGVLTSKVICDKALEKLLGEFQEIRDWSEAPLSQFLDFITYEYMINNVLKLIAAKRSGRDSLEILYKCHPLGTFNGISSMLAASTVDEMFELVLIDSPIGKFFQCSQQKDFDELSLEYIRGLLQKGYLEAFYDFCLSVGGDTATVMCPVLEFEADRLVITVTANTCGMRDLQSADRRKLYPNIGTLVDIHDDLADVENEEQLKDRLKRFNEFFELFDDSKGMEGGNKKSLEKRFVEKTVQIYRDALSKQFQYGVFYAYVKLKELEIQNLQWISDCIVQNMKQRVHEYVAITG